MQSLFVGMWWRTLFFYLRRSFCKSVYTANMKIKVLNLLVVLTSLFGYLEWGKDNHMFLFQGEYDILVKLLTDPGSVMHPLVMLPLLGQVLLLSTLFQKAPGKMLTYAGIGCIGLLLGLMFFIGVLDANIKILCSTLPFLLTSILAIWNVRKRK